MNWKQIRRRTLAAALGVVMALGLVPASVLVEIVEAADFDLGSGFTDPAISVTTMYYWKEGLPPVHQNADGKMEGSTIGAEYPVYITWGGGNFAQYFFNPSTYEIENTKNGRVHRAHDNPANVSKDCYDATVNVDNNDKWPHGSPPGFYVQWRDYTSSVGLFSSKDIAQSLMLNGVAANMDVDTNLYMVPVEGGRYAFEIGRGSNKWIVGEQHYDQKKRGGAGYENSLDWHLDTFDYAKNTWIANQYLSVREHTANKVDGYVGNADHNEEMSLANRTWTFSNSGDGKYSIGTDGTASWYIDDWTASGLKDWRKRTKEWVNGTIWDWTELWLSHEYHFGNAAVLETWGGYSGDWSHAQANQDGRYLFRVFYGEPNIVSFIQTDTKVQSGQVVNLDGPIVIGQNATITVESGGVLVVSGWIMNGGFIMVKPGGMLIVQDQERKTEGGAMQYGVITNYQDKANQKYGRISCDGIMIVNRDCKVFGAGTYGIQFGEGAQCINYGQLISENFEVYSDHTIENRGDVSAVFAGWGLTSSMGFGFVMANQKIAVGSSYPGQGTIEGTSAVRMAKDAVYGPGASRVYINSASKVSRETNMSNRKGFTTEKEAYIQEYKPQFDSAYGIYYVTDAEGVRYDYYNSLQNFARFNKNDKGEIVRYDFGGRALFNTDDKPQVHTRVPDYDKEKQVFFLVDSSGKRYEYDMAKGGFLDIDALTDVYYPGTVRFPPGVTGFSVTRNGSMTEGGLEDGAIYFIESALQADKLIDVAGYSQDDGGGVHLWSMHGGMNQQWKLVFAGSEKQSGKTINYYKFISVNSGKALSIDGSTYNSGTRVAQYTVKDDPNHQKWRLIPNGDGFTIVPKSNPNVCIDVNGGSTADGAAITLWNVGNNLANQRWHLIWAGSAEWAEEQKAKAEEEKKKEPVFDLKEGVRYSIVPADNPDVRIDPSENHHREIELTKTSDAKEWFVLEKANVVSYGGEPLTYYYLKVDPDLSGRQNVLGLDPISSILGASSDVNLYRKDRYGSFSDDADKWVITPVGDGAYYIRSANLPEKYALGVKYDHEPDVGLSIVNTQGDGRIKWKFVEGEMPEEEPEEQGPVFEEFKLGVRYNIVPADKTSLRIDTMPNSNKNAKLSENANNKQWFVIEEASHVSYGGEPLTYYYLKVDPTGSTRGDEVLGVEPDGFLIDSNSDVGIYLSSEYSGAGLEGMGNQWRLTPAGNGTYYISSAVIADRYGLGMAGTFSSVPTNGHRLGFVSGNNRIKWAFLEEGVDPTAPQTTEENTASEETEAVEFEEGVRYSIVPEDNVNIRIDPGVNNSFKISLAGSSYATQWFVLEKAASASVGGEPRTYYYIKVDPDLSGQGLMLGLNTDDLSYDERTDVNIYRSDTFRGIGEDWNANQWLIIPAGDGSYYISSRVLSEKYALGVEYGRKPAAGYRLVTQEGDKRVKWKFVKE